MFGRFRHLLLAAAWGLGIATIWAEATPWPQPGYLPQAGPMPLRFRPVPPPASDDEGEPPAPPVAAPIILPPPPMPPAPKEPAGTPPVAGVTNAPALEMNAREHPIGAAPVVAPEGEISPQMLIKYFSSPTNAVPNAAAPGLQAPVGFKSPLGPALQTPPAPSPGKPNNTLPP